MIEADRCLLLYKLGGMKTEKPGICRASYKNH
jgi:hypothetical protein